MKKRWAVAVIIIVAATVYAMPRFLPAKTAAPPPRHDAKPLPVVKHQADAFRPMEKPVRLIIPSLQIDSAIHAVGTTPDGAMDIPDSLTDTGWYEHSVHPGSPGKAVLAAHTGYPNKPTKFRGLEHIQQDATISIEDSAGQTAHFRVIQTAKYRPNTAPLDAIFGDSPTARLNIITCTGTWNQATGTYTERLVVFAARAE